MMRQKIQPIIGMLVGNVQREMDGLAARGEIERVDVRHLMLDILSLNIFPFVAYPIIQPLIEDVVGGQGRFRRPAQTREYRDHHAAPQKTLIDHETNPYPVLLLHGRFPGPCAAYARRMPQVGARALSRDQAVRPDPPDRRIYLVECPPRLPAPGSDCRRQATWQTPSPIYPMR